MSCATFRVATPANNSPIPVNRVNRRGILNPGIPRWILPSPGPVTPNMGGLSPTQFPANGPCGSVGWMPNDTDLEFGDASIQNANPPLMPHLNPAYVPGTPVTPSGPGTPAQGGAWYPEILLVPSTGLNQTAIPQSTLDINIFVDKCVIDGAYPDGQYDVTSTGGATAAPFGGPGPGGPNGPCGATLPYPWIGDFWKCTKIFLTMAPGQFGAQTTTAPWGANILNHYPTAEFEVNGYQQVPPYPGGAGTITSTNSLWRPCNAVNPGLVNLCPSPALGGPPGYAACDQGYYSPIRLIRGVANAWGYLVNQYVQVQATYMIPHTKNLNKHLIFSSQIVAYQIL
jgi:hypothetical protein